MLSLKLKTAKIIKTQRRKKNVFNKCAHTHTQTPHSSYYRRNSYIYINKRHMCYLYGYTIRYATWANIQNRKKISFFILINSKIWLWVRIIIYIIIFKEKKKMNTKIVNVLNNRKANHRTLIRIGTYNHLTVIDCIDFDFGYCTLIKLIATTSHQNIFRFMKNSNAQTL